MFTKALLTAALISAVSAHQNFQQLWINNVTPGKQVGIRMPPNNSPVKDLTSKDMACNVPSTNGAAVKTLDASAGDAIKVQWDKTAHAGPITHYLKAVDNAATATGDGDGWFKIDELNQADGKWASEIMGANNMMHEFKLPTGLAGGEYLLRSEMLALHTSETLGNGEFYIGCAQLKIAGTGSSSCGPTIAIPGAYKKDDAGIYIPNYYDGYDKTSYKAPGGPVASCGAGSGGAPPATPSAPQPDGSAGPAAPSAVASPSAGAEASPSPVAPSSPAPPSGTGNNGALPATFSINTLITWLQGKAGSSTKGRRHARDF